MQTKHFFHTLLTSTKIKRRLMRRNVVLNMYNRATYFDQMQVITYEKHVTKSFIACAICHMSKNFYACVGMCVCNHMPLLKVPGCVSFLFALFW